MYSGYQSTAESSSFNKLNEVQSKIDETRQILNEDIDRITDRGERLHLLVDKTDRLSESSVSFRVNSRNLQRSMYWRNIRLTVMFVLIIIVNMICRFLGT